MHTPYEEKLKRKPDFKVKYRIYTKEEGGRQTMPFQGIRWDFWYPHEAHKPNYIFMIWPEFLNADGSILSENTIPVPVKGIANMWIINTEFMAYHIGKIVINTQGYFQEGPIRVGECEVIELIGLKTYK